MKKINRKIKWVACLLCVLTLLSAVPLFPLDVTAAEVEYLWGYTGTDLVDAEKYPGTIAGAGTLDVSWTRGGYYRAENGLKEIVPSGNHSYTEGIIVYPGMKIWWTDPTDPAGHGEVAAIKFWTDATYKTTIYEENGTQDYMGSRKDKVSSSSEERDWIYGYGGSTALDGNGMLMQNKMTTNGVCYTYWNFSSTPKYVTLSYKGKDAVPIYYSAGEPQLLGEDNVALPRQLVEKIEWSKDRRLLKSGSGYTEEVAAKSGYLLSSVIEVKPDQSIVLFSDRTLNAQTGADSQEIGDAPTYTFAAFSSKDATEANFLPAASIDISNAKISKGPISNTGVVVYQYTNKNTSTVYVRISYCCTEQRGANYQPSNVYLYEDLTTYKPIRTNTQAVAGYFSNEGATTVNATVMTPPAPSKTKDGVFFGWQVEYTKSSTNVKEFYPPETELNITTTSKTVDISSEIKMTPVYLDALPFTYDGASVRTLLPTGLQFKLYFRKSDFDKMVDVANATKGSLSVGAFAVPQSHMNYFLLQNNIAEGVTTTALKNQTLSAASEEKIQENFTKEWFVENGDALRAYAEQKLKEQDPVKYANYKYTAALYMDGCTDGSYMTIENIGGVDYCVAYYTLGGSWKGSYFGMDFAARAYLSVQYEYYDANGVKSYKYGDPLYGEFKTKNIRNTEEVLLATLRNRNADYAGIQYFTEDEEAMQADINLQDPTKDGLIFGKWKFNKDGRVYESFTYHDPDRGIDVTVHTRRFSSATLKEFSTILKGTVYEPRGGNS